MARDATARLLICNSTLLPCSLALKAYNPVFDFEFFAFTLCGLMEIRRIFVQNIGRDVVLRAVYDGAEYLRGLCFFSEAVEGFGGDFAVVEVIFLAVHDLIILVTFAGDDDHIISSSNRDSLEDRFAAI